MTTKLTPPVFYSTMTNSDVFQPQPFDHRRTYASNVREITRADGSIVKEFVFENPHTTRSTTNSDDEQKSSKEKFAEIKAKFEQNIPSSPPPKTPSTYQPSISRTNSLSKTADVQYEMIDENGNHLPIDGIENIIKMSGVATREFQQDDGTIVREYVIDDPTIVSQVQQKSFPPPPPPPRLARQAPSSMPLDLQTVEHVEKQRPYQFVTSTGRQIQFVVTEIDDEPTNPFEEFPPLVTEPIIDWSILRQQDPDGQIDPEFIRQFINQRHQAELQSMPTNFYSENVQK